MKFSSIKTEKNDKCYFTLGTNTISPRVNFIFLRV